MTPPEGSEQMARRFGVNLRRYRRRADLSQEELGRLTGLHRTAVGLLESGARVARVDTMLKLAHVLEITPDDLCAGIHWVPRMPSEGGSFSIQSPAAALAREARDELEERDERRGC